MDAACSIYMRSYENIQQEYLTKFIYLRNGWEGRSGCGQEGNIKRWFKDIGHAGVFDSSGSGERPVLVLSEQ